MLTAKIKACFLYYKHLLRVNFVVSLLIALLGWASGLDGLKTFCFSLVTGGAFLSSYFYERQRGHQYYFFFNLGLSKGVLYGSAILFNIVLAVVLLVVKNNLR
ncbi:hypothetical protein [Puia dinghuensis]|uniref:Uncharacterized protein n=1 Tax=Puia dinghuensis TaxID=1792502 RepID=A0A8J2XQK9_9BACT|nr:hypothetical protein [Puia dinghuensis]GGA93869.1 hypothetical protein GCM10011511_16460 [Puia dinghuensis]